MIAAGAFAVFALGLRHGADPDHLAAIDNVTRNAYPRNPALSRFAGAFFAGGHTLMVLVISALAGFLGTRLAMHRDLIEAIGTLTSIVVLVAIALVNLRNLRGGDAHVHGVRTRLLPAVLRDSRSAFVAVPIGVLFGFGFDTASQIVAYTTAFGSGVVEAVTVGLTFCAGMVCTDVLDSLLVHRLISHGARNGDAVRVWIVVVTALSIVVAAYEAAQFLGWRSPLPDIALSGLLVTALGAAFAYVVLHTRRRLTTPD
jgi:nickel/cobalt transporter (NiCoT) family protein